MTQRPLLLANHDTVVGGGEVGLVLLAEALAARDHRPVIAVPGTGRLPTLVEQQRLELETVPMAAELRRLAAACDVVHTYSAGGLATAWRARVNRPIVWHELLPNPTPLDARLARLADVVVANSRATACRFGRVPHLRVVYNGIAGPRPVTGSLGLPPGRRTIAIAGPTCPRKGQLDALPALAQVLGARDDVDVVLAGRVDGRDGEALRHAAGRAAGRLRLLGFVPGLADHLGAFSLVLVPSRSEGFGRIAVEALRAGVPVLATRVEGLVEALDGLDDPWLPTDRTAWAARILEELDHPRHTPDELRAAAERFDPDRFVEEILAIYRELTVGRG